MCFSALVQIMAVVSSWRWPSLVAKQHKTLVLVWRTLYMHPTSLFTRLSPWTTTKKSEEESLVPFCTWCTAHQCHSFNDLFCYVTTTELQLLWQQKIDREIILMAMTAKEVTWWYRQPGILVQFTISIECNLLILLFLYTIIVASECKGQLRAAVWILPWSANGVVTVSIWYCLSRTKVTHLDPTGCSRTLQLALRQEMYSKFTSVQYCDVTFSLTEGLTMVAEFEH